MFLESRKSFFEVKEMGQKLYVDFIKYSVTLRNVSELTNVRTGKLEKAVEEKSSTCIYFNMA